MEENVQGWLSMNDRIYDLKIRRIEICDLLIACTHCAYCFEPGSPSFQKWSDLHDKLNEQLAKLDKENEIKEND